MDEESQEDTLILTTHCNLYSQILELEITLLVCSNNLFSLMEQVPFLN